MSARSDTTAMLSARLEELVLCKFPLWAPEVSFGKHDVWDEGHVRVDYMAYRPKGGSRSIRAVECGEVHVFEVKSCMADLKSGHGVNRIGDVNWLVMTDKLYEQMIDAGMNMSGWNTMMLVGDRFWGSSALHPQVTTGRKVPLSQAMWAMLMSSRVHVRGDE